MSCGGGENDPRELIWDVEISLQLELGTRWVSEYKQIAGGSADEESTFLSSSPGWLMQNCVFVGAKTAQLPLYAESRVCLFRL